MNRPRRVFIYQLLPRLFGNTNVTRKQNGTILENGVGKFADITDRALVSLRDELGVTHIWLTGVLSQVSATDYSGVGIAADDPDLLKGLAGSPYAIKDYGDVCPDYAVVPERRLAEFRELVDRIHANGLFVLMDFVANHVARCHASALVDFGRDDDRTRFFSPSNHFFWLQGDSHGGGPPLRLPTVRDGVFVSPTCRVLGAGDGRFPQENETARVTGNNAATWSPSEGDWYETVKLNYGYDFTTKRRFFEPVPDTWWKMDVVLTHWQSLGVDGFRCDMAHMVPPEFWRWCIGKSRARSADVMFIAEAYDDDQMKVESATGGKSVMRELVDAGFDAVYDDASYKVVKRIFDGPSWANDLDGMFKDDVVFSTSLRYAENHDEVRLASRGNWGGHGAAVGPAVCAILWGLSGGPAMIYHGQEVGEPASGSEGFSGDNGRTSIFDYWSMPELVKWVNGGAFDGGGLSVWQRELRVNYGRLMRLYSARAFRDGEFIPLNPLNIHNDRYGRIPGEPASGHWLYSFARMDEASGERYVVVVNLHPSETARSVRIHTGESIGKKLRLAGSAALDRFGNAKAALDEAGLEISEIPPLTPAVFEVLHSGNP